MLGFRFHELVALELFDLPRRIFGQPREELALPFGDAVQHARELLLLAAGRLRAGPFARLAILARWRRLARLRRYLVSSGALR